MKHLNAPETPATIFCVNTKYLISIICMHTRSMVAQALLTVLCVLATIHVLSKNRSPYLGIAAISNNLLVESLKILDQERPN